MLLLKPTCENCNKLLPVDSTEAMICTFECTYCKDCVDQVLENVCPNCGGGFVQRPVRPKTHLSKYPASTAIVFNPVEKEALQQMKKSYKDILPEKR